MDYAHLRLPVTIWLVVLFPAEKSPGKDRPAPSERPRPNRENRRPPSGSGTSGEKGERVNENRPPRGPRPNRGRLPSRENEGTGLVSFSI